MAPFSRPTGFESQPGGNFEKSSRNSSTWDGVATKSANSNSKIMRIYFLNDLWKEAPAENVPYYLIITTPRYGAKAFSCTAQARTRRNLPAPPVPGGDRRGERSRGGCHDQPRAP